MDVRR